MTIFNANPASTDYPRQLREVRQQLGLSQADFAVAAGYSGVMQGRYETLREKRNSATPSPKTAQAIAAMVEAAWAERHSGGVGEVEEAKPLKSLSPAQFEQAVRLAVGKLTGVPCVVTIKDVVFESGGQRMSMSLEVSQEQATGA